MTTENTELRPTPDELEEARRYAREGIESVRDSFRAFPMPDPEGMEELIQMILDTIRPGAPRPETYSQRRKKE